MKKPYSINVNSIKLYQCQKAAGNGKVEANGSNPVESAITQTLLLEWYNHSRGFLLYMELSEGLKLFSREAK